MRDHSIGFIVVVAVCVRLFVLALGAIAGLVFPHYDRSGGYPFAHWDAVFYIDIARKSYEFEQQYAFQPLLPMMLSAFVKVVRTIFRADDALAYQIAGLIISNGCFVLATVGLYRLGQVATKNERLSYLGALAFCFTPAGIFMSAVYTESLFACTSFWGLYFLYRTPSYPLVTSVLFSAAVSTRSNGVVLVGFLLYNTIQQSRELYRFKCRMLLLIVKSICFSIICVAPFITFLAFGYSQFCYGPVPRPYCTSMFPNIYSFVQAEYWGLGFLKYFVVKQVPNFLLAIPVITTTSLACASYILNGGYVQVVSAGLMKAPQQSQSGGYYAADMTCFVYHAAILTVFVTLVGHIQISTRLLLSSSPLIYWFIASSAFQNHHIWTIYLIWSAIYTCVGTCLFSCFLPWT